MTPPKYSKRIKPFHAETLQDAMAAMLIYLAEQEIINPQELK